MRASNHRLFSSHNSCRTLGNISCCCRVEHTPDVRLWLAGGEGAEAAPDLGSCQLQQKLAMVQLCIRRRRQARDKHTSVGGHLTQPLPFSLDLALYASARNLTTMWSRLFCIHALLPGCGLLTSLKPAAGDRRTASAHDGWEVDFDFMLEDGDGSMPAEPGPSIAEVASPHGAPSPGSSQYGSASEGAGLADEDMLEADDAELPTQSPQPSRAAPAIVAVTVGKGIEGGGTRAALPIGTPAGVARQLGDGLMLLRHPGTAINVPLTQVCTISEPPSPRSYWPWPSLLVGAVVKAV